MRPRSPCEGSSKEKTTKEEEGEEKRIAGDRGVGHFSGWRDDEDGGFCEGYK